jgi:hypothetical protein
LHAVVQLLLTVAAAAAWRQGPTCTPGCCVALLLRAYNHNNNIHSLRTRHCWGGHMAGLVLHVRVTVCAGDGKRQAKHQQR